ncbi:MAG: phosphatase PAP2 family protein [Acidobacteria bacterium]|nr:MAG: phosphatase PAP2 family protein [Acidobacteriota bacterium]
MVLVTAGYFVYLAGMAVIAPVAARRKARVLILAFAALAGIAVFGMPHVMPLVYLLLGYWLPALLVGTPNPRLERRLLDADHRLFGVKGLVELEQRAPRIVVEYLELAYLLCYAAVPAGYAWLVLGGFGSEADSFWSIVLLASFLCYGLLPWMPTRAPRAVEGDIVARRSIIRRLNLAVLDRASVQWNTFPSGHTAASVATALAVGTYMPSAGIVLGVIAVSIATGSVVGRYHYAADAITGVLVAILAFALATAAHGP